MREISTKLNLNFIQQKKLAKGSLTTKAGDNGLPNPPGQTQERQTLWTPNPPPRFAGKYHPQANTRSSQCEEEPLPSPSQDRPVQNKEPSRMEGASNKVSKAELKPLQALVITMSSLQENMTRLIQKSKEAATASPNPVHSQQVHVQPASYPWHVNEPTPTPMAVPNQLHPFQLVDPANSNPNHNLIPVNQSGQNVQPGGQYSHPIWQRPIPRAWGHL